MVLSIHEVGVHYFLTLITSTFKIIPVHISTIYGTSNQEIDALKKRRMSSVNVINMSSITYIFLACDVTFDRDSHTSLIFNAIF